MNLFERNSNWVAVEPPNPSIETTIFIHIQNTPLDNINSRPIRNQKKKKHTSLRERLVGIPKISFVAVAHGPSPLSNLRPNPCL
jgi:hypothetical protein